MNDKERREFADLLGYSSPDHSGAAEALREVAKYLGFYEPAVNATKSASNVSPKRGRSTAGELMHVINQLRRIFQRFYCGDRPPRPPKQGTATLLSVYEEEEREFVKKALEAAGIPHRRDIRRYFTDPGAVLMDRGDPGRQVWDDPDTNLDPATAAQMGWDDHATQLADQKRLLPSGDRLSDRERQMKIYMKVLKDRAKTGK